ncbi:hypothetical protein [Lucifera butyrica]|uniref:hypothetical protein n=1 Tax=Lucifera butyrica TaxID=1351585 RepID=UPI000F040501|nr:hypothetical protein [Lucifera butyrica]
MEDRFIRGYIAGVIGGIVMVLLDYILFVLGISEARYLDLVAIMIWGYVPLTVFGQSIAQVIQLGHAALVGITFAFLVPVIDNKYLLFKGATYGAVVWFTVFAIGSLYKLSLFYLSSPTNAFSHLITSAIWGVVAAVALTRMEKYATARESRQVDSAVAVPAYKRYTGESDDNDS